MGRNKGKRNLNPTDAYRKKQRQKELKKVRLMLLLLLQNKAVRLKVREAMGRSKDPIDLRSQIAKLDELGVYVSVDGQNERVDWIRGRR